MNTQASFLLAFFLSLVHLLGQTAAFIKPCPFPKTGNSVGKQTAAVRTSSSLFAVWPNPHEIITKVIQQKSRLTSAYIVAAIISTVPMTVFAQIPSYDDFQQVSGTKIVDKSKGSNLPSSTKAIATTFSASELKKDLQEVEKYAKNGQWDEILKTLAPISKAVNAKAYGYGTLQGLTDSLGVSTDNANAALDLREDLSFSLGQLSDFALSKRVLFFNKEDLAQINLIKSGERSDDASLAPKAEDVQEAVDLMKEILNVANQIESYLK